MKKTITLMQTKFANLKNYRNVFLSIFVTLFVLHFVFLILFCFQAQAISENIDVEVESNSNPISVTSDRDFNNVTFYFKVSTEEFGDKSEIISLDSIKKDSKTDIELKLPKNDNLTIEKIECQKINTNLKTLFFILEIIVLVFTIITGIITAFIFND